MASLGVATPVAVNPLGRGRRLDLSEAATGGWGLFPKKTKGALAAFDSTR